MILISKDRNHNSFFGRFSNFKYTEGIIIPEKVWKSRFKIRTYKISMDVYGNLNEIVYFVTKLT
ncbi:hypothetical protein LEP1GSC198_1348 [Leptospira kirschneri str. JB]|nr:hypothetical protein LEP1GSC198_1348 [Leptospira kirschneri str. JB]